MSGWLGDTLALYGRVFRQAAERAAANWPLAALAVGYPMLLALLARVLAPYGILGGFVVTAAAAACFSSWLHFMEQVVRRGRANLSDLGESFGTYLADLLNVGFLLFLLQLLANVLLAPFPLLVIVFFLATLVFLNAVPELVYLGRNAAPQLLAESYRFIGQNWIEWFPANFVFAALIVLIDWLLPDGPFGLVSAVGAGLVAAYVSIARGLLFLELTTSSRRAREFRRRAGG